MRRIALLSGLSGLVIAIGFAGSKPAIAQADPATRSLIERLRPTTDGSTRGIRIPADAPPAAEAPAPAATPAAAGANQQVPPRRTTVIAPPVRETTAPVGTAAVSMTVNFSSGSAMLTPDAERALAPLGRALASADLAAYRFRIEGHTDTVGDATLNQTLSERRAATVRQYLQTRFNIPAARLEAVGFGANQLLVQTPAQVNEPRNRRVQVVNLGG